MSRTRAVIWNTASCCPQGHNIYSVYSRMNTIYVVAVLTAPSRLFKIHSTHILSSNIEQLGGFHKLHASACVAFYIFTRTKQRRQPSFLLPHRTRFTFIYLFYFLLQLPSCCFACCIRRAERRKEMRKAINPFLDFECTFKKNSFKRALRAPMHIECCLGVPISFLGSSKGSWWFDYPCWWKEFYMLFLSFYFLSRVIDFIVDLGVNPLYEKHAFLLCTALLL